MDTAAYAYWAAIGAAYYFCGDLDAALGAAEKALADWTDAPAALRLKAAICGLRGRVEEGRNCVERLLALNPETTAEAVSSLYHKTDTNGRAVEDLLKALRTCGLPVCAHARGDSTTRLQ